MQTAMPLSSKLYANYPNPFNPSTAIRYDLQHDGSVQLNVFNTLGQNVSTIVDENQRTGSHVAYFEPRHMASGVYVYRITAGAFTETKRMLPAK